MNMSQFQITSYQAVTFRIFSKGQEYSTLEAAYDAYEKLLTEDKYVEYKDTLPKL